MTDTLVDANVLIDILSTRTEWTPWSVGAIADARRSGEIVVNQIIFAEFSVPFSSAESVEAILSPRLFRRDTLPWEATFRAAKVFVEYRKRGGSRSVPLPDFFIGAHAAIKGYRLLTRDTRRYATYFPEVELIAPEAAP